MAAAACNVISQSWCEQTNAEALDDLIKNHGVTALPLPPEVIVKLKEATVVALNEATAKDPLVKKVHDNFMAFKATADKWAGVSEAVYHAQIRGQI